MKKMIALLLALVMVLALTACGNAGEDGDVPAITKGHDEENDENQKEQELSGEAEQGGQEAGSDVVYFYTYEGVKLVPNDPFDPSLLPEAESIFEVPSCAIEGTDNLYNYGTFELTAFDDGTGEVIYSIFFVDPNITTDEGLALGDDVQKMIDLYGENYVQEGTAYIYTGGNTVLSVLVQNDVVTSIEFRMAI